MHHECSHSQSEQQTGGGFSSWFVGLIIGVLGGAAVALLTAPKPGSEMRGALKKTARRCS